MTPAELQEEAARVAAEYLETLPAKARALLDPEPTARQIAGAGDGYGCVTPGCVAAVGLAAILIDAARRAGHRVPPWAISGVAMKATAHPTPPPAEVLRPLTALL